ncbi:MAG: preprotein translocase subunit SecY [Candidatus Harrisonbacteria bacterium CG10_big_fil_rev_8_21_14_0_10_42_17]|uniref:Protein translocase subunit SecY n=1 Tax=Candidatus Harrisonbacteria bacterium CG10_big_fil_rev_8_21_14_0_10_42_17 TaxID=1974584 RepID=A0A2M6WHN2_9BACT|nr:MAG: preprotein translocase subunit SecY [Candidatus Harrisonbacteria bacterium CG10_big_fil_rev_8_21_14_0_10_42_17]
MFNRIIQVFRIPELRKKILIVLGLLVVFRVLASIPIPGVNIDRLSALLEGNQLLGFLNIFSGGGLSNLSLIMLGLSPYITSTIIMQLLTLIFPRLKEIYQQEGSIGRAKFNRISRYLTVPLAMLQSYGFLNLLINQGAIDPLPLFSVLQNVLIISTGSVVLMWIGELISEQKIGNGISLLIFSGIVASLPSAVINAFATYTPQLLTTYIAFVLLAIVIIAGVVYVNQGERKIPISYSKRIKGNRMYGGSSSYLPLKVNQAGVIPIIFAVSLLLFPQFLAQMIAIFSQDLSLRLNGLVSAFLNNQYIYSLIYFVLVFVFTYFYTAITFDPEEIAKNLQRSGGFIPGIRPGEQTGHFMKKITNRITLFGAIFLGVIAVLPNVMQIITGVGILTIGGTALLIVVSVALETANQIDSQLTLREYEGIR